MKADEFIKEKLIITKQDWLRVMEEYAESQLKEVEKDKERLDYLQSTSTTYGWGWILRKSAIGRGMRLHETSDHKGNPDVREAIDIYKTQNKEDET